MLPPFTAPADESGPQPAQSGSGPVFRGR